MLIKNPQRSAGVWVPLPYHHILGGKNANAICPYATVNKKVTPVPNKW